MSAFTIRRRCADSAYLPHSVSFLLLLRSEGLLGLLSQLAKVRAMQHEYARRVMTGEKEQPKQSVAEVRKLGLIPDQKPEDVNLKTSKWIPHLGPSIA